MIFYDLFLLFWHHERCFFFKKNIKVSTSCVHRLL